MDKIHSRDGLNSADPWSLLKEIKKDDKVKEEVDGEQMSLKSVLTKIIMDVIVW